MGLFADTITYAERDSLHALIVSVDGQLVVTRSGPGRELDQPHPLYSGTKSFWGITAVAAAQDGLLELEEPLAATFPEWTADARKSALTARQLLDLTSGYGFGGLGNGVPTVARALDIPLKNDPGQVFTYGGVPLQIFGEFLRRKLRPRYDSPHAYLTARVLDRIGMMVSSWRRLADGTQPLPTGAFVAANEWLKFGQLLCDGGAGVIDFAGFAACTTGSVANPKYGLGLWLQRQAGQISSFYASGAGGQGLYIIPQRRIVAVRFGRSANWNHAAFIKRLTADAMTR